MEEKDKNIEEEFVEAIPNPYPYVMIKEQYEESLNYIKTKESIEKRKEAKNLVEKISTRIDNKELNNEKEECVDVIPNPCSYVMTREQYEEIKNRKLSKEEIEIRKKMKENADKIKKQIRNETEICK